MHGVIGKISCVAGQRDALAALLLDASQAMPGCLSYVIALDPADADALWGYGGMGQPGQPQGVALPAGCSGGYRQRPPDDCGLQQPRRDGAHRWARPVHRNIDVTHRAVATRSRRRRSMIGVLGSPTPTA